jgi:hypothetical protein
LAIPTDGEVAAGLVFGTTMSSFVVVRIFQVWVGWFLGGFGAHSLLLWKQRWVVFLLLLLLLWWWWWCMSRQIG